MGLRVGRQIPIARESLIANAARKWFFLSVGANVLLKFRGVLTDSATDRARHWIDDFVEVGAQFVLGSEMLATVVANQVLSGTAGSLAVDL